MGNGQVERFNRTFINMLKTLPDNCKNDWKSYVNKLTFAYNSTVNKSTNFSPHFLMFGRQSRLPIDFKFSIENQNHLPQSYPEFVQNWHEKMSTAYQVASKYAKKNAMYGKNAHDKKVYGATLQVGDKVLLRNLSQRGGTGKLRSYWENDIYQIESCRPDVPVYKIKSIEKGNKTKVVHRNMLMKCDHLPPDSSKITKIPHTKQRVISHNPTNNECSSNESEDDCIEVTPNIIKHFARNEIISENEVEEGVMIHQTNTSVSDENVVDQILVNTSIDSDTSSLNQINDTLDSNIDIIIYIIIIIIYHQLTVF